MGDSGSRRSTLVSRLPIFRRSASKRQDSLPSSPSSGGVGNGVHTSSPSSTNSSSSSTGKRRSLFRTPSISFSSKRNSAPPRVQTPPADPVQGGGDGGQDDPPPGSLGDNAAPPRAKTRHSFGFGGHRQKKISRSQTGDFEKAASAANRNVFINCISSGYSNEGDDSGFMDDYSAGSKRTSRQRKPLLPKSFSSHHRLSKDPEQCLAPEVSVEPPTSGGTPGSWPGELLGESSLQSPILSDDRTAALTPSEFNVPITEDSVSEVEALPSPVPAAPLEDFRHVVSTSQVFFTPAQAATDKPLLPDTSITNTTECETAIPLPVPEPAAAATPETQKQQLQEEKDEVKDEDEAATAVAVVAVVAAEGEDAGPDLTETSESEAGPVRGKGYHSNPEQSERRSRNALLLQELGKGAYCGRHEPRPCRLRKPHTVSMCSSSASPYHEVMRMERRLRSSSEGAGGPRGLHLNLKEPHCPTDGNPLIKKRNNSSSSKLGSLDVLNNLGSSELDEDDLMLDLDLSDDQRQRHLSREDSSQSLASCLNLLHSPMEASIDGIPGREPRDTTTHRELCRPTTLLPADWCLGRDDEAPGLEALPLRLMQQDCTSMKTLLLRLRRTLQESTDTSPASSLHSLPISPCSEKSLPFKEPWREEALVLQLREKDELILRLQAELESAKATLKSTCQKADRTTQTDSAGPEGRVCRSSAASSRRPLTSYDVTKATYRSTIQAEQQAKTISAQGTEGRPGLSPRTNIATPLPARSATAQPQPRCRPPSWSPVAQGADGTLREPPGDRRGLCPHRWRRGLSEGVTTRPARFPGVGAVPPSSRAEVAPATAACPQTARGPLCPAHGSLILPPPPRSRVAWASHPEGRFPCTCTAAKTSSCSTLSTQPSCRLWPTTTAEDETPPRPRSHRPPASGRRPGAPPPRSGPPATDTSAVLCLDQTIRCSSCTVALVVPRLAVIQWGRDPECGPVHLSVLTFGQIGRLIDVLTHTSPSACQRLQDICPSITFGRC
ncbi:serine-rich coiled-coil domain-containing protein 1 isoform X2 [Esox lucius]|uniref:serine-rich coiled-coil domain-containing protein 1 isoform X2 n=1 Tax=Esox lucius TaxID=8010 RepID=UPI0014774732|nr:serine-rich coiled-coil domain-containing protein 1 isoform X2 [Esox lucius]